jgi:nitroreductase
MPSTEPAVALHPLIQERRSPRAFADRAVARDTLISLFEAARWSASAANLQPWRFIVAPRAERESFERMLAVLVPQNAAWANQAPVLALTVAEMLNPRGAPNRHAMHDVGLAAQNLTLQATALGLAVHQMGGFEMDKARASFTIPEGFEPVVALAIGYPGDPESLPEPLRSRELAPRARRPLSETVFGTTWGEASSLIESGARTTSAAA